MPIKFEELAYIRKLNAHELGYRKGEPSKAGRYFLISKNATSFFPPLSNVIINDNVILDIIPPFENDIVLTKYVYHNDKIASDGTRDEHRLYLNTKIDPSRNFFQPDDIIVFIKIISVDNNWTYKMFRYTTNDREYSKLNTQLEQSFLNRAQKSHAIIDLKNLDFLNILQNIEVGEKVIPQEVINEALTQAIKDVSIEEEDKYDTTRIIRSRSFRDLVMYFYENQCAITKKNLLINYETFINLEAAHIIARASGGGSHPSNGLALERNLHWAFDKGFFTLTKDYRIEVHDEAMRIPYLKDQHGRKMLVPQDDRAKPNPISIKWHRENVFGLFLRTDA